MLALAFGLSAWEAGAEGRSIVRVREESVVQRDRVTLGDIATIQAADPAAGERLRAVALGYAPEVGAVREIARARISLVVAAAGFGGDSVVIEGPPVARIRRAAQTIDPAVVRAAVERAALAELRASGATAELVRLDLPPVIEVPSGAVEARAALGGVRDLFSPFAVSIELLVDGRVVRRLGATAQVAAWAPVVVAARDLPSGTRLRQEDTTLEPRRLTRDFNLYLRDVARLRGASTRRAISQGEAVTADLLASEIVIRPGDPVRIIGESGALYVAVTGEARAAGRIGDRIQVKNSQSGTMLQAIIVDEGVVRVHF
jgi:flagella basal body P-ring formation protein FlgA